MDVFQTHLDSERLLIILERPGIAALVKDSAELSNAWDAFLKLLRQVAAIRVAIFTYTDEEWSRIIHIIIYCNENGDISIFLEMRRYIAKIKEGKVLEIMKGLPEFQELVTCNSLLLKFLKRKKAIGTLVSDEEWKLLIAFNDKLSKKQTQKAEASSSGLEPRPFISRSMPETSSSNKKSKPSLYRHGSERLPQRQQLVRFPPRILPERFPHLPDVNGPEVFEVGGVPKHPPLRKFGQHISVNTHGGMYVHHMFSPIGVATVEDHRRDSGFTDLEGVCFEEIPLRHRHPAMDEREFYGPRRNGPTEGHKLYNPLTNSAIEEKVFYDPHRKKNERNPRVTSAFGRLKNSEAKVKVDGEETEIYTRRKSL